jgi:signal transduction histidine kinase
MTQNNELELHRTNLEKLVESRTEDLVKAKKKAEESDRLKTAFLANLSHEIRTPLNAIVGFSNLLSKGDFSEKEKSEFVQMIQRSADNLLVLINDIIDISRIETGQIKLNPKCFQLGPFLNDIITSLSFEPTKSDMVDLQLDVSPEVWKYKAINDEQRLRQIIVNLLNNAFKFTHQGHVRLCVERLKSNEMLAFIPWLEKENMPDNILLFIIEDTGIGISPKHQQHIFEPFIKLENKGKTLYSGMGLGLSIVKSILQVIEGSITVKSQPGHGTTFYCYVPDKACK